MCRVKDRAKSGTGSRTGRRKSLRNDVVLVSRWEITKVKKRTYGSAKSQVTASDSSTKTAWFKICKLLQKNFKGKVKDERKKQYPCHASVIGFYFWNDCCGIVSSCRLGSCRLAQD